MCWMGPWLYSTSFSWAEFDSTFGVLSASLRTYRFKEVRIDVVHGTLPSALSWIACSICKCVLCVVRVTVYSQLFCSV